MSIMSMLEQIMTGENKELNARAHFLWVLELIRDAVMSDSNLMLPDISALTGGSVDVSVHYADEYQLEGWSAVFGLDWTKASAVRHPATKRRRAYTCYTVDSDPSVWHRTDGVRLHIYRHW